MVGLPKALSHTLGQTQSSACKSMTKVESEVCSDTWDLADSIPKYYFC